MGTRRSYTALTARHGLVAASVLARLTGCVVSLGSKKMGKTIGNLTIRRSERVPASPTP